MWRCQAPLTFVQPLPVYGMDNVLLLLCKKGYNSPYLWVVVLVSHLGSIVVTTWTTSMPAAAIVNFSGSSWSKENKQEEVISVLLLLLSLQKALWKEHQRLLGGFEEIPSGYVREPVNALAVGLSRGRNWQKRIKQNLFANQNRFAYFRCNRVCRQKSTFFG